MFIDLEVSKSPIFILPLIFIIFPLVLTAFIFIFSRICFRKKQTREDVLQSFAILVFLFQPLVFKTCFEALSCRGLFPEPGKWVLYFDLNSDCYDEFHFIWMGLIIIPSIIFYGVLFPFFYSKKIGKNNSYSQKNLILAVEYRKHYLYWYS